MNSLLLLNEDDMDLLVAYSISSDEEMCESIINAFHAANVDVFEKPTQIVDWVNTDVFNALQWSSDRPILLSTRIWNHHVVITAEEVRIYTPSSLTSYDEERRTRTRSEPERDFSAGAGTTY